MQIRLGRFAVAVTATNVLFALTIVVSLAITATGSESLAELSAGFIPARFYGAQLPPEIWGVPFWLTPLSATFVHIGLFHLASNMLMLFFAGRFVEHVLGWRATLLLYVLGAYAAAGAQWATAVWLPGGDLEAPMAGASGAISALIGAYALLYSRPKAKAVGPIPAGLVNALWLLAAWAVLSYALALVFTPGGNQLAWAAHIGGFVLGLALARPLLLLRYRRA